MLVRWPERSMKTDEFERLLDLYLKGRLSASQKADMERQLDDLHRSNNPHRELDQQTATDLWKRIVAKKASSVKPSRNRTWIPMAAAIVVASVAAALALFWNNESTQLASKRILEDGTIVWLKNNATLDYSTLTSTDRQVTLAGEALFEVAKNPQHPFIIHCGRYVARVLGTSFNIKAGDSVVELTVLTGQVKLSSLSNDSSVVVRAHEHVVFTDSKGLVSIMNPGDDEVKAVTANTQYDMHFEDTRMDEIVKRVEGKFDVKVVLESKDLGNCMVSADFTDQSLPITLSMISEALGFEYEIDGKRIVIHGAGCKE